jgi:serine/threonine-protein kinase
MTPDDYRRAGSLFEQLCQLPDGARAAALDSACAGNAELRAQVEHLLEADSNAGSNSFLERHAMEDAARLLAPDAAELPDPGTVIGNYRLGPRIAAGGMGAVYEGQDLRLKRPVAVKVLPAPFAAEGAEQVKRFKQESRAASLLNHPNIVSIFDADVDKGYYYIAMELIEGKTLRQLIVSEPERLDSQTILDLISQTASALSAAHQAGIVHRDIKPENIMLRPDGFVKVLDFGLAKLHEPDNKPAGEVSNLRTRPGLLAGTIQYLSPEQVAAKPVDARSDLFSLGVVAYELATGVRPFDGPTDGAVYDAILNRAPAPPSSVRPTLGGELDDLILRALDKDLELRFQTAADMRSSCKRLRRDSSRSGMQPEGESLRPTNTSSDLGDAMRQVEELRQAGGLRHNRFAWSIAGATMVIAAIALFVAWRATRPVDHPLTRLSVDLGPEAMTGLNLTVAISPDGRRLAYPVRGPDAKQLLATRLLDQAQHTLLQHTENGSDPFFSPDGQWIGFLAGMQLKKISVQGGAPVTLSSPGGATPLGASWGQDGNILAGGPASTLWQIPAAGGPSQPLTKLGPGEISHEWPQVLPGGDAALFTASTFFGVGDNANIEAISRKTGQVKIVQHGGYYGRYLPSGHLVYMHQGVLFGVKFDPTRLEVRGAPVPLLEDVAANAATGGGQFDFSSTGTLVYASGKSAAQGWQVAWMDSSGKTQPLRVTPGRYVQPRFSPDGKKLAFVNASDVYIYDPERDTNTRLTFTGKANVPIWARDGKHIVFQSVENGFSFNWVRSDGSGAPQQIFESPNIIGPWSFSPDGRQLAYYERNPNTGYDLWTLPLDISVPDHPKPGKPEPLLRSPANEIVPRLSPDGRWVAYRSDESGHNEIYVRRFLPGNRGRWQISSGGGSYAFWSNNGRELLYETTDYRIMVMDYTVNGDSFVPGKSRLWSDGQLFYPGTSNLDLAPDGKRFAVLTPPETPPGERGSVHVTMLLNFFDELKRRIPAE